MTPISLGQAPRLPDTATTLFCDKDNNDTLMKQNRKSFPLVCFFAFVFSLCYLNQRVCPCQVHIDSKARFKFGVMIFNIATTNSC
jgi:hypothetical protein